MNLSEKDFDLIHRHLSGSLDEKNRMDFETKLKDDAFRTELIHQAQMIDALAEADYLAVKEELKGQVSTSVAETASGTVANKSRSLKWLKIGLFLAGMLALAWLGFTKGRADKASNMQYAELVKTHNVVYPPVLVERGSSADLEAKYLESMKAYANEDWTTALNLLKGLDPQTDQTKLYQANCLIQERQYSEAQALLGDINSSDSELTQNKDWYSVICALGLKKNEQLSTLLQKIAADKNHLFYSRALKLKEDLD